MVNVDHCMLIILLVQFKSRTEADCKFEADLLRTGPPTG